MVIEVQNVYKEEKSRLGDRAFPVGAAPSPRRGTVCSQRQ